MGKKLDVYDPRLEQIRAQRQGIYETEVRSKLGLRYNEPFRDETGRRLDLTKGFWGSRAGPLAHKKMFSIGTAVPSKHGRLHAGTQEPTAQAASESFQRYQDPDHVLRNRQDYEETLGLYRKGFYRVVPEYTKEGVRYFVWPLENRQRQPRRWATVYPASMEASRLNSIADPRVTGRWWRPSVRRYTRSELKDWLPPDIAFGRDKSPKAKKKGKVQKLRSTHVPQVAREVARQVEALLDYHRSSGAELRILARKGDKKAQIEIDRRAAKRSRR